MENELGVFSKHYAKPVVKTDAGESVVGRLEADDVVLISGGARGVTAAVAAEMAKAMPCTYVLWGRTERKKLETWVTNDLSETQLKSELSQRGLRQSYEA